MDFRQGGQPKLTLGNLGCPAALTVFQRHFDDSNALGYLLDLIQIIALGVIGLDLFWVFALLLLQHTYGYGFS